MAETTYQPNVIAYSLPSQVSQTLVAGETNVAITPSSAPTYTITTSNSGVIAGFFFSVNGRVVAFPDGYTKFEILRNGVNIYSSTILWQNLQDVGGVGIVIAESLGFLAGQIISQGETFAIKTTNTNFSASEEIRADIKMFLAVNNTATQFIA